MKTRTATVIARKRARRLLAGGVVLTVVLAHAAVLTSLEAPSAPSGRGQAVVSSAVIVRQVAPPAQVHEEVVATRRDPAPEVRVDAPVIVLPTSATEHTAEHTPAGATSIVGSAARPQPAAKATTVSAVRTPPAAKAVAAAAARTQPAVATALARPAKTQAASSPRDADARTADAFESDAGMASGATEALLPEHLLRSLPTYAVRLPPSQRMRFRVSRGDAQGEGTLDWLLHDDGRYSAALRLRGEGLPGMDWTSEGDAAGEAGVLPRRMVAHRKGRAVAAANFALDEQKVSFSSARVERPFVRGGQDRLTWMLQLAGVLEARTQPLRDDERIVLYVVGPRGAADLWQWRVAGRETLGDGAAAVPAIKLVRDAQRLYDTEIELWLDPAQHHLPLKWRQQQRGVERAPLEWERVPG